FLMMYALPGDPVRALYGEQSVDPSQIAAIKAEYGLDKPLWQQYINYISGLPQGGFGTQIASPRPVAEVMGGARPASVPLPIIAFVFTVLVGVSMGIISGMRAGKKTDTSVLVITLLLISMPSFVLGFLFQWFFAMQLGWVTPTVQDSMNFGQLFLPAIVLASLSLAYVARLTRTSIAENLRADYMRTAVAKGLPRRRIISMHLMRNSMIPVVTFLGIDIGNLMTGAIV